MTSRLRILWSLEVIGMVGCVLIQLNGLHVLIQAFGEHANKGLYDWICLGWFLAPIPLLAFDLVTFFVYFKDEDAGDMFVLFRRSVGVMFSVTGAVLMFANVLRLGYLDHLVNKELKRQRQAATVKPSTN